MSYAVVDIECSKRPLHKPWTPGSFLCSVGIERQDGTSEVWFFNPNDRPHEELLAEIQAEIDSVDMLVGHNIKFDLNWLKWIGLDVADKRVWCTMIADYLLYGQQKLGYSLNDTASRYDIGQKLDAMKMYWDSGYETDQIPLDIHKTYLLQDVSITHDLFKKQVPLVLDYQLDKIVELSFDLTQILSDMEVRGVAFDKDEALMYCEDVRKKTNEMDKTLVDLAGVDFVPSSTAQLSAVMFGGSWKIDGRETYTVTLKNGTVKEKSRKCKVDKVVPGMGYVLPDGCVSKKTGKPKTDKNTVDLLKGHDKRTEDFLSVLREQRKLRKVVSSIAGSKEEEEKGLIAVVGKDNRIHPSFNQCVTRTGRLSSADPNGQNFPRSGTSPIKKFFKSSNGVIVNLDLAQIEWRIAAELSRDEVMLDELRHGLDIHADNAVRFFGAGKFSPDSKEFKALRTTAKVMSFRLLYGGSASGFYRDQKMPDYPLKKWKEIVDAFYAKYKGLKAWQNRNVEFAKTNGYVRNPSGRVLTFDQTVDYGGVETVDTRQVSNFPVQSAASDIMYLCMVKFVRRVVELTFKSKLVLQVHDSMVWDCPLEEAVTICQEAVKIFKELPQLAKEYFGWDIVVPLMGDCEIGYDYGTTFSVSDKELFDLNFDVKSFLLKKHIKQALTYCF